MCRMAFRASVLAAILTGVSSSLAFAVVKEVDLTPVCGSAEIFDPSGNRCVSVEDANIGDVERLEYAYSLAKQGLFEEALDTLDRVKQQFSPKYLNYRGYVTRNLGRVEEAIGHYRKALLLDPHYAEAREYLGEAFIKADRVDLAEEQLILIARICGTTCEPYEELREALQKARGN